MQHFGYTLIPYYITANSHTIHEFKMEFQDI